MVPPPARRDDQVCREPAQEVPGHLSDRLRERGLARPLRRAARRLPLLDRPRRDHLPGRQPAHQAVPVLGLGDPRGLRPPPRDDLPGRGVHPAQDHAPAGQRGLPAVLQLLHLAEHQGEPGGILHRADDHRQGRLDAAQPLRQHPGHPPRISPGERPGGLPDPPGPGGHPGRDLRDLRAALRALRRHALEAGFGRIPRLGEVPGPPLGPRRPPKPPRPDCAGQPDPPREPCAPGGSEPQVLPDRQRGDHRLRQVDARRLELPPDRGQPRPPPHPVGLDPGAGRRTSGWTPTPARGSRSTT